MNHTLPSHDQPAIPSRAHAADIPAQHGGDDVIAARRGTTDAGLPAYAARCECGRVTFGGLATAADVRVVLAGCFAGSGRDEAGRFVGGAR